MKIISDFHDYYDSVMIYGQDSDVVFNRDPITYDISPYNSEIIKKLVMMTNRPLDLYKWYQPSIIDYVKPKMLEYEYSFNPFRIIFCGEIYPGIQITETKNVFISSNTYIFYTLDELFYFLDEKKLFVEKKFKRGFDYKRVCKSYFEGYSVDRDFLIKNKITIVIRAYNKILINEELQKFGFYKVLDAYSAFQTLNQWISGTLTYPPNIMLEIEDKYKVESHGFDSKYGFRTRPKAK
jgi:hypothetical protein